MRTVMVCAIFVALFVGCSDAAEDATPGPVATSPPTATVERTTTTTSTIAILEGPTASATALPEGAGESECDNTSLREALPPSDVELFDAHGHRMPSWGNQVLPEALQSG